MSQTIQLVSLRHSAFYTPYLMTFVGGFLQREGLQAEYRCLNSVDEIESALLDGSAHVAQSAVGVSMRQLSQRSVSSSAANGMTNNILHFAQINSRDGFFLAVAPKLENDGSYPFNWRQLENKRVIADHLFQPMATLRYVLEKNHVDINSIEFIDAGNAEQSQQAFIAGKADYVHLQGPYPQQLVADKQAVIVASVGEALGEFAFSSLCANSGWLTLPIAKQFMRAYKKAICYVQSTDSKVLAGQLADLFESISMDILTDTIEAYKRLATWSEEVCISRKAFEFTNQVFILNKDVSSMLDYQQIVTTELC